MFLFHYSSIALCFLFGSMFLLPNIRSWVACLGDEHPWAVPWRAQYVPCLLESWWLLRCQCLVQCLVTWSTWSFLLLNFGVRKTLSGCNGGHEWYMNDHEIFSRGSLESFTCRCYGWPQKCLAAKTNIALETRVWKMSLLLGNTCRQVVVLGGSIAIVSHVSLR